LVDEIKSPEGSAPLSITVKHIEDLFHTIDQDGTGKINFEEFNIFFETILRSPTILSTSSQRERET
jgi:Ca2+-binding EF-hand superfamily protein